MTSRTCIRAAMVVPTICSARNEEDIASGLPGRGVGLFFSVIRSLPGNAPELLASFVKGSPRLSPLGIGDFIAARPPQLLDGFDAPKRTGPRCADGLAAHKHIDGIGVKLRKMSKRDPTTLIDLNFEAQIVCLTVSQNLFGRDRLPVHHNLDEARTARHDFIRPWAV